MSGSRRRFGAVRKLESGLWQARFRNPAGRLVAAPNRFRTKADADRWLGEVERSILAGTYVDSLAGATTLKEYAERWLLERPKPLAIRTTEEYQRLLTRLIVLPQ